MIGWHHRFNGHQFEQTQGDSEGQGSLACYSPWDHSVGHKKLPALEQYIIKLWVPVWMRPDWNAGSECTIHCG